MQLSILLALDGNHMPTSPLVQEATASMVFCSTPKFLWPLPPSVQILPHALVKALTLSQLGKPHSHMSYPPTSHIGFVQSFFTLKPRRFFENESQIFFSFISKPFNASPSFPRSENFSTLSLCLIHTSASILIVYSFSFNVTYTRT